MINFMKNSLISRFVMLFLFVFGCGTMSPIPALADYSEVLLTNSNGAHYVSAESGAGLYDYVGHGDCDADARVGLEVLFNLLPNGAEHTTIDFTPYAPDARTFNNDYAMVHDYDTDPDVFNYMTLYDILSQAQSAADSESLWNPVVRCQFLDSTYMYSDEFYGSDAQNILMGNYGIAEKLSTIGGSRKWLNAFTLLPSEGRCFIFGDKEVSCDMPLVEAAYMYMEMLGVLRDKGDDTAATLAQMMEMYRDDPLWTPGNYFRDSVQIEQQMGVDNKNACIQRRISCHVLPSDDECIRKSYPTLVHPLPLLYNGEEIPVTWKTSADETPISDDILLIDNVYDIRTDLMTISDAYGDASNALIGFMLSVINENDGKPLPLVYIGKDGTTVNLLRDCFGSMGTFDATQLDVLLNTNREAFSDEMLNFIENIKSNALCEGFDGNEPIESTWCPYGGISPSVDALNAAGISIAATDITDFTSSSEQSFTLVPVHIDEDGMLGTMIECRAGEYWPGGHTFDCDACDTGYYCPGGSWLYTLDAAVQGRSTCPADIAKRTVKSSENSDVATDCYVTCPSTKTVANAKTVTVVDATPNYNGTAYPACRYTVTCNDGYTATNNGTATPSCDANTYTLTFNANSGSGTAPTITTCTYESCVLPENTYTKLGHVFSGWYFDPNDDGEIEAQPGENIGQYLANSVAGQTIEIAAGWVPCSAGNYCPGDNTSIPCAVGSYSAAGASSCTACQNGTTTTATGQTFCDATCANAANAATWIDAKWLTNNELSYRCAIDTCKTGYYRNGTGDSTFGTSYACDPNTYTITYSCGDGATGTPPANQTVTYNQSYTSEKTIGTCTKEGYVVEGWNTTVTSGTTVPIAAYPGASGIWTFTENKTFTARWKPKCYKVDIEYSYDGNIGYNAYYIKHGDSSVVYSDVQCTQETYIDQYDTGHDGNGGFVGLYDDDDNMCMDDTGELSGDCLADGDGYTWTALYSCNSGYTAHGDTVWAGDICSNCYQVKLSPAEGYSDADFLYTDGTENYVDAMCQNPYQGIIAPAKENATWVGYTNRSWDKNYTGEYPTDALCTSDESQGANTGKCPVTDNNQTWTAVYKCNDGYKANGTYVDYNTECSQNVYSVDLVYYCSDPTGAGDKSTPPEKPSVCYSNRTCIMPENSCYYEGYQFTGWRVDCNTCGDNSKIYVQPGDDISWQINALENGAIWDVNAMWELNTYTVTLDANGGTGGTSSVTATYGSAMPSITVPTRSGYTFNGYFTAKSGGTQYYTSSGASARNWDKTSSTTLYAQWTLMDCAVGTYPIDASGNYPANGIPEGFVPHECLECPHAAGFCPGGLSAPAYAVTFMEDVQESILLANINNEYYIDLIEDNNGNLTARRIYTLPDSAIPTRTGYVFDGYWTQSTGGEQYIDKSGNFLKGTSTDIELYAHWNASVSTVTLDANGGTGGTSSVTATYDSAMPSITVPTRSGYTFNGYFTATSGGTQYYTSSGASARNWDKTSSTTLYAQWTQNVYTVVIPYSCGDGSGNAPSTLICKSSDTSCILSQPENCKKEDFVFVGWTLNNELQFTGDDIKSFATSENNGKTYTATAEYAKTAFTMTVKPLSSGDAGFTLGHGVTGVFAVDWGDGTTTTVNKTRTTAAQDVAHVYSDVNNEYLIQIASLSDSVKDNSVKYGKASLSVSDEFAPSILKLGGAGLGYLFQGSKLSMFSSVSSDMRVGAFANATNLVEISPTLFNGYTEVNSYFADAMFTGCTSLKTVSLDLFDGLVTATGASSAFGSMFKDCINLTTITNQSAYQTPFIPMDLYYNSLTPSQFNGVFTNTGLQNDCPEGFITKRGALIYGKPLCQPNEFTVTTTSDTKEFSFTLSAAGTYYIDWGDSTQVVTLTEPKSSSAMHVVSHTYDTATAYDIKLAGQAIKYYPDGTWGMNTASISFANNTNVAKINGSLGTIFGTLESTGTAGEQLQPRFKDTFSQCSKLTGEIPADLFSGITGQPSRRMFQNMFFKTNVSGDIPADLFAGINGEVTDYLFAQTFYNCSGLTGQIPEKLFKGITGELTSASNRTNAFNGTFYGCSNLGKDTDGASLTLPVDLFAGLSTANYEGGQMADIFGNTGFATTCPGGEYKVTTTEYPFVADWSNKAMCMTCPTDDIRTATSVAGNNNGKNSCYVTCPSTITVANAKTVTVVDATPYYNGSVYPVCTYTATCNDGYSVQNNGNINPSCTANTYTVAYDNNDGAGTMNNQSRTYNDGAKLTANIFTRTGYTFAGWNTAADGTGTSYGDQATGNLTSTNGATVTLYAQWGQCQACSAGTGATCSMSVSNNTCTYTTACLPGYNTLTNSGKYNPSCSANTYTVAYDNNDGTGTMNNQSRTYNDGAKLTANILTRTGYTFVGWNTAADGSGTSYGDQATGNLTSTNGATVTLYAQWGQCQACNAGMGATCSMSVTNNTCTYTTACKTGYNTLTNSGKYNPSCTANTYTVTYSCGDGDGTAPKSTTATYDSVFTMAQNTCSKTGYDFVGWKVTNADDAVYQAGQKFNWTYLENKTFVAQWSAKRITCQSGEFLDITSCVPCSVGFKCPAASVTYTYNADIQGRTACSGTSQYQNQTGQTVCKTVDDGYYKISDTAQAVCGNNYYCKNSVRTQCPDGGITNTETASLGSQCYKSGMTCTADDGSGTMTCHYELTTNDYTDCTECSINKCADGYYMDGNACEICPVGWFCANNVKTLCPPNYTTTDVGAVLKTQCVTTCSDKDVVYGTAYKDTATVLWPAVCTHTYGISVTGNPCKIIDNVCVETSCKYDYEMIDGKCELCVRDNALSFKQGNGNCIVETCLYGYRPFGQSCISDTIECSADDAVAAEQKWDPNTNSYGPCTIIECATGYHIEENSCVLDTQECTIENGTGEKVYDHDLGKWGECVVSSCLPGYTNNPKLTHEIWKSCGRCNNMFGANGERIVSSYLTECEIASCMYQGEKYTLENNECISICDERSDETGSRYWDGNKCVHDCKPGFLKW